LAIYPAPHRRVAGDFNPQQYRCENLKYCNPLALDVVQWLAIWGCFECGNEPLRFIKVGEYFNRLNDCWLFK
jgi:hypothetical protein